MRAVTHGVLDHVDRALATQLWEATDRVASEVLDYSLVLGAKLDHSTTSLVVPTGFVP